VRELARRLAPEGDPPAELHDHAESFWEALADDFNTPGAWAALSQWIGAAHRHLDKGERFGPGELREMLYVLGLDDLLEVGGDTAPPEAEQLLAERQEARAARDFARADQIRDELAELGWVVRDTPEGATLVPKE
jgi:cysteinyl-tRNA synthetase